MKKDVIMFEKGAIVDFAGKTHPFVVCALSTSNFKGNDILIRTEDENGLGISELEVPRAVFIGVAVCNPVDEWSEEKGKSIALNKARGFNYDCPEKSAALFATRAGLISEPLVQALLNKEVQHIIDDPNSVIKGYNQMKASYIQKQEDKKYLEETPKDLMDIVDKLVDLDAPQLERVLSAFCLKSV